LVLNQTANYSQLFAAVLKTCNVKLDYQALAAEMGEGKLLYPFSRTLIDTDLWLECTPKAIIHRVSNIRARAAGKGATETNGDTSAPATPKGRKASAPKAPKTPKTPKSAVGTKRKGKAVKAEENGGMDDEDGVNVKSEDELMGSPSKKPKVEEDDDDDGDGTYMGWLCVEELGMVWGR
jgi:hypothetical protein